MPTTPAPTPESLTVLTHPLVQHKISILRRKDTGVRHFRELVTELSILLACEATSDLRLEPASIETPLETTSGQRIQGKKLALIPVLRAGLGMVDGFLRVVPNARVGHIGLYRDHDTLKPVEYYFKVPPALEQRSVLLLDPMLATGGSAAAAVTLLKRSGAQKIRLVCLVASPEGVQRMTSEHPDLSIVAASLDRELNSSGYILPGLGDAGDRLFGTL